MFEIARCVQLEDDRQERQRPLDGPYGLLVIFRKRETQDAAWAVSRGQGPGVVAHEALGPKLLENGEGGRGGSILEVEFEGSSLFGYDAKR